MKISKFPKKAAGLALFLFGLASQPTWSGSLEQAKRIHDRLAGVPPSEAVLLNMAANIDAGDVESAAYTAMDNAAFYDVTLKNWAAPWTNRDSDPFVALNDYVATLVGIVRDGVDFRELLFGDILYTASGTSGIPAYSNTDNAHYEALEAQGLKLQDVLVQQAQSSVSGLPSDATAGVMTSRAASKSFFIAGTNRAMFRFTLLNHLCNDLEQVHDISRVPDRIRQDVTRSPGGDSRVFLNNCVGCHNGMDPMAQAFAYYNYEFDVDADPEGESGQLVYNQAGDVDAETGTRVQAKYHINENNFIYGYVTPDDQWENRWRSGINARLGWSSALPGSGAGAKSMGRELAYSDAFAQCQVEKVFTTVCLREPGNAADRAEVNTIKGRFSSEGFQLKQVFADTADYCKGP